ncbi:vancomycin resistance protein [Clostridiaceae bacterium OM02-2AC]|nr:vancomycin resistance protein [Clostridiaceae bacterium OM02-2AC]
MQKKQEDLRTKKRSDIRLMLGGWYYTWCRYLAWHTTKRQFASEHGQKNYPYVCFQHKSLLKRNLTKEEEVYQENKIMNLRLAVEKLDGIIVYPQETLSYWKTIGKPTASKGYREGMMLKEGTIVYGIGGGLCQLSNLLFWITIHTPLEVVERHRHGYDVFPDANRTQPFGSGATCFYPYGDLMIVNPTQQPFQLRLHVGKTHLHGEWRTLHPLQVRYDIVERNHEMRREWWGGYSRHNQLYRLTLSQEGTLLEEQLVAENHAMMMYQPLLDASVKDGQSC